MKIYTMTVFDYYVKNHFAYTEKIRTVGFYTEFEVAKEMVENNNADMADNGYYPYALIEEVPEGTYPFAEKRWFFKFNRTLDKFEPIDEPIGFTHQYGFGIG